MKTEISFIAGFSIGALAGAILMKMTEPKPRRKRRSGKATMNTPEKKE
jgi:predicted acylesterase/phospholipase RssA